jgi:NAD(P)H-hydrate epimerase
MAAIERASEQVGVSTAELMENAGLAVARAARNALGGVAGAGIVVLVGPGNNGADGLVAARHLRRWGGEVTAYLVAGRPQADPQMDLALGYGVAVEKAADDVRLASLDRLLARSRLVIDAVLGTGRARPLQGQVKNVMVRLGELRAKSNRPKLIALDLPTGLNADTGEADPACPWVDSTLSLGYPKAGLLSFPGAGRVGELQVLDIGVPSGLSEEAEIDLEMLTPGWVADRLPERPLNSHKGTFGHALVIAGSRRYVGAAYLAAQAAVRTGAGLTTLASPLGVYPIAAAKSDEAIHFPLPEDAEGRLSPEAASLIQGSERRYSAMAVGSGLGWSVGTTEFMQRLLCRAGEDSEGSGGPLPVLIDADGLNNLSQLKDWPQRVLRPLVLTPHPGEMATLTGLPVKQIQQDRVAVARLWSARWNACVVLKGANTVIARPEGLVHVSPFANPGLASGGTGDVLSGVIVALLAQGLSPGDAACCGVYLHALAAGLVTERLGNVGAAASDLLDALPRAIDSLRYAKQSG